jgi:hypothetical protein
MNTEHVALFDIGAKITYTQCLKTQRPCHVASAPLFIFEKKATCLEFRRLSSCKYAEK